MLQPTESNGSPLRVSRLARTVSAVIHLLVAAVLVLTSASAEGGASSDSPASGAADGARQLTGDAAVKATGRNQLYEILSADDAVRVRLTSPDTPAVGMAYWSPSRGMWLAVDLAAPFAGQTLHIEEGDGDRSGAPVASVELDSKGSGRVVAVWVTPKDPVPGGRVTLTVTARRGIWPFNQTPVVLTGTARAK